MGSEVKDAYYLDLVKERASKENTLINRHNHNNRISIDVREVKVFQTLMIGLSNAKKINK